MTATIHEFGTETKTVIIVPTSDVKSERFAVFRHSISGTTFGDPKIIAVESFGDEFNFSRSVNKGLKAASTYSPRFIVISNDDVKFRTGWLDSLLSCFDMYSKVAYVAPDVAEDPLKHNSTLMPSRTTLAMMLRLYAIAPMRLTSLLIKLRQRILRKGFRNITKNKEATQDITSGVSVNCQPVCAISSEALSIIGYFDENYTNGMEDTDFTFRSYLSGFTVCLDLRTVVSHHISATGGKDWAGIVSKESTARRKFLKNLGIFLSKYSPSDYRRFLKLCHENTRVISH